MSFIHRILCPTDFSANSREALTYALRLAEQLGASVTLMHVSPIPIYVLPGGAYAPMADDSKMIMESARKELEVWLERYSNDTKVELDTCLVQGEVYKRVNAVAEERGVDVIVMGTHGRSGLSRVFLGSVAERIVRTSSKPVLTIPGRGKTEA